VALLLAIAVAAFWMWSPATMAPAARSAAAHDADERG
jgi:hypothetical protein